MSRRARDIANQALTNLKAGGRDLGTAMDEMTKKMQRMGWRRVRKKGRDTLMATQGPITLTVEIDERDAQKRPYSIEYTHKTKEGEVCGSVVKPRDAEAFWED